jgi:hypothetical protein
MWKRELVKNKILSALLTALGVLSVFLDGDCTFLLFTLIISVPMFFSKTDWTDSGLLWDLDLEGDTDE